MACYLAAKESGCVFITVFIVAIVSDATATVVGFGIGSLMTPLLAIRFGTTAAVALVTLPNAAATAVPCWRLRAHVDRPVLGGSAC